MHTTCDKPYMDRKGRAEVQNSHYIQTDQWVRLQSGLVLLSRPPCILRSNRAGSNGSFVGAAGLSQWPVVRHGGEERVPQLAVDEEHDEEDEEEKHQTHHHIRGQVGFVGLSLSHRAPAARGLQEGRHAHGPVGHAQRRLRVCVGHQVKVSRRCRGVQQHLPQHDESRPQQTNIHWICMIIL